MQKTNLLINCDIGERGMANAIDDRLIEYIDIANIACGGHAGDNLSVDYYSALAARNKLMISAHLSYPDKLNFGRTRIILSSSELLNSLDTQYALLPVGLVKFHGALYHDANCDQQLANLLFDWLSKNAIAQIIAPEDSYLSELFVKHGFKVYFEGFIERGYYINDMHKPCLIPRGILGAELLTVELAYQQYQQLIKHTIKVGKIIVPLRLDTACIHSDSIIALELAKRIYLDKIS